MNPILGVGLALGITGLVVWAMWKSRALVTGYVAGWGGPVSPDGGSCEPGWSDPLEPVAADDGD
jgi:hypothetical protein